MKIKKVKKINDILVFLISAVFLMAGIAMATPTNVSDNYVGADDHNYGDVIGSSEFETSSATVNLSGNTLTVDIYTAFAGLGNDKKFRSYTKDPYSGNKDDMGIGYGDLFLASVWDPFGTAPYKDDDNGNGTVWTYGFALDDRWGNGGNGTLYSLDSGDNNADALLSEDFITGAIFRDGQEVAVDTRNGDVTSKSTGTWSIDEGTKISFSIDIAGTDLLNGSDIAFHWGQTCANDVIEGSAPIPEPATMLLFGTGLIGMAAFGRRKFLRK